MLKSLKRRLLRKAKNHSPTLQYLDLYQKSVNKLAKTHSIPKEKTRDELFSEFLERNTGKRCLQIGVKDGKKFGDNWVSVDKYDDSELIDYNYDIHQLEFADESFDAVVCWSVLEHVPYPEKAISELHRVLRAGGEIWVQMPLLFPYHRARSDDYWRVTPSGLRIWMKDFEEQGCACDFWAKTPIVSATYFYGYKR